MIGQLKEKEKNTLQRYVVVSPFHTCLTFVFRIQKYSKAVLVCSFSTHSLTALGPIYLKYLWFHSTLQTTKHAPPWRFSELVSFFSSNQAWTGKPRDPVRRGCTITANTPNTISTPLPSGLMTLPPITFLLFRFLFLLFRLTLTFNYFTLQIN